MRIYVERDGKNEIRRKQNGGWRNKMLVGVKKREIVNVRLTLAFIILAVVIAWFFSLKIQGRVKSMYPDKWNYNPLISPAAETLTPIKAS